MEVAVQQMHVAGQGFHQSTRHDIRKRGLKSTATPNSGSQRTKGSSKQLEKLFVLYSEAKDVFYLSGLAKRLEVMLQAKNRPRITKAMSLGLGSLAVSKDQPRRIKQLVIFMAIISHLQRTATKDSQIPVYAQDPTFDKTDEQFLRSLGITVLKTPSPSDLGEAGNMIDRETLVYSPFLTIAAYGKLFSTHTSNLEDATEAPVLVGDDFNALKMKWEKRTAEHKDVESLIKVIKGRNYQRRVISGDGFWTESDNPFPMALYWRQANDEADTVPKERKSKI